jgi:hypothetical protein
LGFGGVVGFNISYQRAITLRQVHFWMESKPRATSPSEAGKNYKSRRAKMAARLAINEPSSAAIKAGQL